MADFITTKANGDSLDANEWNQFEEIDNAIDSSGLTLTTAQKDQLKISMARYASGANFYTDGGSANAYVLTSISHGGGKSFAPAGAGAVNYFNGMNVRFRPANNNSGASTVNVSSFGLKDIRKSDGTTALTGGELTTANDVILRYDSTNSCFIIQEYLPATSTVQGVVYRKAPTITKLTSGSGTYPTPAGALYLRVRQVGGGGGGAGSGTIAANNHGSGGNGGTTTFGTSLLTADGGAGGGGTGSGAGGVGGSATINSPAYGTAIYGGSGINSSTTTSAQYQSGGMGAPSALGGASGRGDIAAQGNSGSGGAAGFGNPSSYVGGSGGAGGFIDAIIPSPSATYAYSIASAGTAGSAGTGGFAGATGGSGYIEVTEYYN